jgi:hypothetical protein
MHGVVDAASRLENPREAVPHLFAWFEANAAFDVGNPGPLVHFIERQHDYFDFLAASLARKPTTITLWTVNRIANGAIDADERQYSIGQLRGAATHPLADSSCKESAIGFLALQGKK